MKMVSVGSTASKSPLGLDRQNASHEEKAVSFFDDVAQGRAF